MNKKGFTLVELLAVIAILGLIIMVATISVTRTLNRSDDKNLISDGRKFAEAARIYYNDQGFSDIKCITLNDLITSGYLKGVNLKEGRIKISINQNGSTTLGGKTVENIETKISWYVKNDNKYVYSVENSEPQTSTSLSNNVTDATSC
ncbi:MAG: type II secretion system protein [Bacilli bacterium]|nr:type II secretion system protein [Bacilli bacterium]